MRLLVAAVVAVMASWRVAEALPEHVNSAPQQKPWLRPRAQPGVTPPAGGFGVKLSTEGDAELRLVTPDGGGRRPGLATPAGDMERRRHVIPVGIDRRPEPVSSATDDLKHISQIPQEGVSQVDPVTRTGGDSKVRLLTPATDNSKPRPVTPSGGGIRSRVVPPTRANAMPRLVVPGRSRLIASRRPGVVSRAGGDATPVTFGGSDVDLKVVVPAVPATTFRPVFRGGDDKDVGLVFPGGNDKSPPGSEIPAAERKSLSPDDKDSTSAGPKSASEDTAQIDSRFGIPAGLSPLPRRPAVLPGLPPPLFNSAEVTVVLPGASPLPPYKGFPHPQGLPLPQSHPPLHSLPPHKSLPSLHRLPPSKVIPSFPALPPSPSFPAPDIDVHYDVEYNPAPSRGGGVLSGLFSHFANKLSGLKSGGGGGLLGIFSPLFASTDDRKDGLRGPLALAAHGIKKGAQEGLELADSELAFQGHQKAESLVDKVERTVETVGRVGQSQYRALLQKKEAAKDFFADTAGNVGTYADKATVATFNKVENSLKAVGRLFSDLATSFLDALVTKGQAASELVQDQTDTNEKTLGEVVGAKREAFRDTVKHVTNLVAGDRGT